MFAFFFIATVFGPLGALVFLILIALWRIIELLEEKRKK
jgi:hypothetical protein